jgi:hypothetical protein
MRIVGSFDYSTGFASYNRESRYGHERLHPGGASWPESGVIYELKQVQGKRLGFTYPRSDTPFRPYDWRRGYDDSPAKVNASCRIESTDEWIIPFDLTTEEELRRFLHYRTDRSNYIEMWPLITAAIQAKRYERELEAPFRTMLAGVLARENGVSVADAQAAVPELVEWYKTTNKWHRPLVHDAGTVEPLGEVFSRRRRAREERLYEAELERQRVELVKQAEEGAKAVRLITAEHARRVRIERRKPNAELVEQLRNRGRSWATTDTPNHAPIMVGRRRSDGRYVVVMPERSDEEVFAAVITWGERKGLDTVERWQLISKAQAARWQVLWAHERWERWDHEARPDRHLTDPEVEQLSEQVKQRLAGDVEATASDPSRRKRKDGAEPPQSVDELLLLTLERDGKDLELYAWFLEGETVLPDPERPLTGEQGAKASVEAVYYRWERDRDGGVVLRSKKRSYTTGRYSGSWAKLEARLAGKRNLEHGHRLVRVLWRDDDAIRRERELTQEFDRRMAKRNQLSEQRWPLVRAIRGAWIDAWWERKRAEWVAEYGKPELWEGQRKIIEGKIARANYRDGMEKPEPPTDGLHEMLAPFIEAGEANRLWGRLVADVFNEAIGRGFIEWDGTDESAPIDRSLFGLAFIVPKDEPDGEDDWDDEEPELVDEGDAEGTIEVAGELESGDVTDAEVVE